MLLDLAVTVEKSEFLGSFGDRLSALPEESAKRLCDELLRLLDGGALNVTVLPDSAAPGAGDRVIRLRIIGLDELLATACRAAEIDPAVFHEDSK